VCTCFEDNLGASDCPQGASGQSLSSHSDGSVAKYLVPDDLQCISLVQVTFGATLFVAVGFAWAWLLSFWRSGSGSGGLRLSAVTCWTVAVADLSWCVWSLSRVVVSCVACVCLCSASALRLPAPMLFGVSLVPLCNSLSMVSYDTFLLQ
jgi:hypothetical protein